jgi:hypothetical protein
MFVNAVIGREKEKIPRSEGRLVGEYNPTPLLAKRQREESGGLREVMR